jgi:hypothetical protein
MNIEDKIWPEHSKLKWDWEKKLYVATIIDPEIDPIKVEFHSTGDIVFNTEKYSYIMLSPENFKELDALRAEVMDFYTMKGFL